MEEVTLQAVKRAMPGHGRARINTDLLIDIGIEDQNEVEVITSGGTSITLTAFADALVEKNQIRISEDDLKKLGISDRDDVTVRRKTPVKEQVKNAADDIADKINKGIQSAGEVLSEKTTGLKEGSAQAAQNVQDKAREVSAKISEQVGPIGEKLNEAGRDAVARIQDLVPISRFNVTVETGLKLLNPTDAAELKKILLQKEDDVLAITVSAKTAAGRTIQNLTTPPDISIVAIQKPDKTLIIAVSDSTIDIGDIVYITGKERGLEYMSGILEG